MPTEVLVPDIGDFSDVPIIEVHVAPGDKVNAEDPLLTLESDKATLDVPAPSAGTVGEVLVKVGDQVSEGTRILLLSSGDGASTTPPSLVEQQEPAPGPAAAKPVAEAVGAPLAAPPAVAGAADGGQAPAGAHAGPSVRRMARELGVDLSPDQRVGAEGADHEGRPAGVPEGAGPARRRGRAGRRAGVGDPGDPGAGLLQVRPGAAPGPAADQEGVGPVPAPVVAQCPARHAQRRGRHHRARRLPQAARHRGEGREEPVPGDAAGVPGQGRGRRR